MADPALAGEPGLVVVLGIDETRRGKAKWETDPDTGVRSWVDRFDTGLVDTTGRQGLLAQVIGRDAANRGGLGVTTRRRIHCFQHVVSGQVEDDTHSITLRARTLAHDSWSLLDGCFDTPISPGHEPFLHQNTTTLNREEPVRSANHSEPVELDVTILRKAKCV